MKAELRPVVTVCGSGRFRDDIHSLRQGLVAHGFLPMLPPLHEIMSLVTPDSHEALELAWKGATHAHFNRIDKADIVLIVNPGGYLGVSSTLELGYAVAQEKFIVAMLPDREELARSVLFDEVLDVSNPADVPARLHELVFNAKQPQVGTDIEVRMARSVAELSGLRPRDGDAFSDGCSLLCESGLLIADEERLGALRRGPYRLAGTKYDDAVLDFVDVLLPTGIIAMATHDAALGAFTGTVRILCKAFSELLRRGVVFGRSILARERWAVLVAVDRLTAVQGGATLADIVKHLADANTVVEGGAPAIEQHLAWLEAAPATVSKEAQSLIRRDAEGRYVSAI